MSPIAPSPSPLDELMAFIGHWQQRPSWDEYFMATALLLASRSICERLQVGCLIISTGEQQNRIIAAGYNGFLPGARHRSCVREGHEQATVHAEQNAICDAARRGVSLSGAAAYVTHFPCVQCTKAMAAVGISQIKYHFDYRNDSLVEDILAESKIPIHQF